MSNYWWLHMNLINFLSWKISKFYWRKSNVKSIRELKDSPCWFMMGTELIKSVIRNWYTSFIWIDCTKRKVLSWSCWFGDNIEESRLEDKFNEHQVSIFKCFLTFPTLGTPTIPIFKLVPTLPINGLRSGSSTFLGGIAKNRINQAKLKN